MRAKNDNPYNDIQNQNALLESIRQMQNDYFKKGLNYGWCEDTLKNLLHLTNSKFGFICELLHKEDGTPFLKSHVITNIAWSDETRKFYAANKEKGLEFFNFESIWGQVFKTGKPYISDVPDTDPNKGGYPKKDGHPHLKKFLGIPIKADNNEVIGIMAVANNPNGYTLDVARFLEPFVSTYGILMIQERMKLEEEKRKQEILDKQIEVNAWLSNSPICTKKVDLDFNLQYMSEAGIRELKVGDVNKLYNEPYPFYFFPKAFKKLMTRKLKEVKKTGEITEIDGILADMEGNKMWYNHMLVPIKNHNGKLDYILVLSADITERKNSEINLQEKNEEYEAAIEEFRQTNDELLKARKAAEESEEKFSTIFNMSQSLICVADINTATFKFINPAFKKVLGYDEDELLSRPFLDFIHPEDKESTISIIEKELKKGRPKIYFVNRYKGKDGHYRHLAWNSFPFPEKGITYAIAHDITEQKKIEQELIKAKEAAEENEQKLKQSDRVFNLTLDMFCIAGFDGYFKYLNPSWERTLGWSIEELLSKPWLDFVHPDDVNNTENIKSVIVDGKEILKFDNRYICKDGSIKWLSWNSQPFPKENIMIGTARDITQQKRIEKELLQAKNEAEGSETFLQTIFENIPNMIFMKNADDLRFAFFNKAGEKLLGYKSDELIGKNDYDFFPKEQADFFVEKDKNVLKGKEILSIEEEEINTKSGKRFLSTKKIAIQDSKGKNKYLLGISEDITKYKESEAELIKAKEKAEESDRLKSAFLANMSHEIRTPMNGILGFTKLLQDTNRKAKHKDYINIITKSGDRLLSTVNDIIEISKIESGEINVTKSKVDIIGHLNTLVTFFKTEADAKNLEIVVQNNIDRNNLFIQTDKNKLSSILSNLIKNAIKYTENGTIKVALEIKNKQVLFSCQDTGIGIPNSRKEAVFNRFEQADIEDKQAHEGSGLGLAIVKSYVEMLDGKIWVESEVGQGSTFYVSIPFEHEKKKEQIIPQEANSFDSGIKNIKVLVVEDDEISSMHLLAILEGKVKNIISALNGIEAIDACKNDSGIDLMLMDIKMPKMGGIEATKKIREFNKDVVIIAQTAYALEGDKEKALNAGCNDYISKPIDGDKLFELINKYF